MQGDIVPPAQSGLFRKRIATEPTHFWRGYTCDEDGIRAIPAFFVRFGMVEPIRTVGENPVVSFKGYRQKE